MGWTLAGVFFLTTILAVIFAVRTHLLRRKNIRNEREKDESAGDDFAGDGGGDAQNLTLISQ